MRRLALVLCLLAVLAPTPAGAQTTTAVDQAVAAFRKGETVFVHPEAERAKDVSAAQQARMRDRIRRGSRAVFVAVLPASAVAEADGDVNALPGLLHDRLGFAGTYAVLAGGSFRAGSTDLPKGTAGTLADKAFQQKHDAGAGSVLAEFVDRVETGGGSGSGGSGSGGSSWLGPVVVLAGLGALLWLYLRRRGQRAADRRALESARQLVRADLGVLADDVLSLEPEVVIHPDARDEYEAAVSRYRFAEQVVDRVSAPEDLGRLRRVLAEGHYAMARARAMIDGREPPPPPPELSAPGPHDEPPVVVDQGVPGYAGAGAGGGWFGGGWFGGSGGLLTGVLLGQMLGGGGWSGGWSGSGPSGAEAGSDSGWDVSGGDFGGGDFGGGFGGGGGDVGGGDF